MTSDPGNLGYFLLSKGPQTTLKFFFCVYAWVHACACELIHKHRAAAQGNK